MAHHRPTRACESNPSPARCSLRSQRSTPGSSPGQALSHQGREEARKRKCMNRVQLRDRVEPRTDVKRKLIDPPRVPRTLFPSPLVGEGGPERSEGAGEG